MGIFNRKDGVEEIFGVEEEVQAPEGSVADPRQSVQTNTSVTKGKPNPASYGIEDAIKLMRQLPNVDSEILITVVNKTLESANIKVSEIIADAENKESNIEERNNTLSSRIAQLQNEISQLNVEIKTLTDDLKETTKVKNLLMLTAGKKPSENKPSHTAQVGAKPQKTDQPASPVNKAIQA